MVPPLSKPKIVKKYTKRHKRHQSDRKIAVKVSLHLDRSTSRLHSFPSKQLSVLVRGLKHLH